MAPRTAAFFDGTNAGLLAAALAVPLLALVVWLGPLRGFVRRAADEQALQRAEIERLVERKRTLTPLAPTERERVDAALSAFEADVPALGAHPNAQLVRAISTLLEAAGARDVRVSLSPQSPVDEPRAPLVVAALDGARPMSLVPHAAHVALRSDFTGLRTALDALRERGRTIQIQRAEFTRDGSSVKAALDLLYWSREAAP